MSRLRLLVVLAGAAVSLSATPLFVPGDLLWATQDGRIYDVPTTSTTSTNYTSKQPIANLGATVYGQMAFSFDAKTAYVSVYGANKVVGISDSGVVSNFATDVANPSGLIRTSTGKMLVASLTEGKVYDITSGAAVLYATGLVNPRNMVETSAGIYIADQGNKTVKLLTPGNMAAVTPLAYNIDAVALASFNDHLYAAGSESGWVFDITAGGNMTGKTPFARNKPFTSLAVGNGKLYAGTNSGSVANSGIWEIPKASNSFTSTNAVAYNMALSGDTLLSVVPNAVTPPPPSQVPEPGTAILGVALVGIGLALRMQYQV